MNARVLCNAPVALRVERAGRGKGGVFEIYVF